MRLENNYIEILVIKMLSGDANLKELNEIAAWTKLLPENQKLIDSYKKYWKSSRKPFSKDEINADQQAIKEKIELRRKENQRRWTIKLLLRAAAVVAIPILLTLGWISKSHFETNQTNLLCEVSAPKGQIAECVLADGTRVWLNAGSTIQYNPTLAGKNRIIKLSGEAYFKVSKNKNKPLIVETKYVNVKVLGTSFNVKAYPEENKTETTLEEGRIELSLSNFPDQVPISLMPGEHATYSTSIEELEIEKTDTYLITAWRDGKYIFKDADLNTLITQLEKLYDVRIYLKNEEMGNIRFRGTFEYKQNILDALETIERTTSLKYKMNGRNIWFDNK